MRLGTVYLMTITGFWKCSEPSDTRAMVSETQGVHLGVHLLQFNMTHAARSQAAIGDYGIYAFHIVVTLCLAILGEESSALRLPSRGVGALFPSKTPAMVAPRFETNNGVEGHSQCSSKI